MTRAIDFERNWTQSAVNAEHDNFARIVKAHKALRAERNHLRTENEALRRFAARLLKSWPAGDVDGGELQEAAIECGLLEPHRVTEPCGEHCNCADYYAHDEMAAGVTCYRRTALAQPQEMLL